MQHNLGRVLACRGDSAEASSSSALAIESFARQGEPRLEGLARTYLAEIKLLGGAPAEAETQANAALEVLQGSPGARVQALAVRARALLAQGAADDGAGARAQRGGRRAEALGSIDEGEAEVRLVYAECLAARGAHGRGAGGDRARAASACAIARHASPTPTCASASCPTCPRTRGPLRAGRPTGRRRASRAMPTARLRLPLPA